MSRLIDRLRLAIADPRRRMAVGIAAIALIALFGAFAPNPAPAAGSAGSYGLIEPGTIIRIVGATIAVIVLLVLSLRLMKRAGLGATPRGSRSVRVLETVALGERRVLYLVAIGERRIIVGASPAGMSAIGEAGADEIAVSEGATDGEAIPADFMEQLHSAAAVRRR